MLWVYLYQYFFNGHKRRFLVFVDAGNRYNDKWLCNLMSETDQKRGSKKSFVWNGALGGEGHHQ